MKKLICILLALTMCLSITGCTQTPADELLSVSSSSDELKALQDQILALQSEKDSLVSQLEDKTLELENKIAALADANTLLQSTQKENEELEDNLTSVTKSYEDYIEYVIPAESKELFVESQKVNSSKAPKYVDGSIWLDPGKQDVMEHRWIWYWGCTPVLYALGEARGCDYSKIYLPNGKDLVRGYEESLVFAAGDGFKILPEEMTILSAIRDFAITREEMEEIVEIMSDPEWRDQNNGSDFSFNSEFYELPNVDVLYTFDENIINEYYRRA